MGDFPNCDLCEKPFTKNHRKSIRHKYLRSHLIHRYIITSPDLHQIKDILTKYMIEHKKKYNFYHALFKFKLHFSNDVIVVKEYMYRYGEFHQRRNDHFNNFILSKINACERKGYIFSHIAKFTVTFISEPNSITYEYYLSFPKPMIEWKFNMLLAKTLRLCEYFKTANIL